jgi:hypothetical protein
MQRALGVALLLLAARAHAGGAALALVDGGEAPSPRPAVA